MGTFIKQPRKLSHGGQYHVGRESIVLKMVATEDRAHCSSPQERLFASLYHFIIKTSLYLIRVYTMRSANRASLQGREGQFGDVKIITFDAGQ